MIRFLLWLTGSLLTYGILCFILTLFFAVLRFDFLHRLMWALYDYWIGRLVAHAKRLLPDIEVEQDHIGNVSAPYIIVANHYSWLDILIIYIVMRPLAPSFVFVMKRSLIKMPVIGLVCWGLGHPMVSKSRKRINGKLSNHIVLETAAREASRYHYGMVIFPEGTRYNIYDTPPASVYANLLNPKSSGLKIVAGEFGNPVQLIDITLAYARKEHKIMDFLRGRIGPVKVKLSQHSVNQKALEDWLQDRWQKKDDYLSQMKWTQKDSH